MLLVVSLSLVGPWRETTVPPVHRGCIGYPGLAGSAPSGRVVAWRTTARRAGAAIFWGSNANGGLLYWLVEGAEASREG